MRRCTPLLGLVLMNTTRLESESKAPAHRLTALAETWFKPLLYLALFLQQASSIYPPSADLFVSMVLCQRQRSHQCLSKSASALQQASPERTFQGLSFGLGKEEESLKTSNDIEHAEDDERPPLYVLKSWRCKVTDCKPEHPVGCGRNRDSLPSKSRWVDLRRIDPTGWCPGASCANEPMIRTAMDH